MLLTLIIKSLNSTILLTAIQNNNKKNFFESLWRWHMHTPCHLVLGALQYIFQQKLWL